MSILCQKKPIRFLLRISALLLIGFLVITASACVSTTFISVTPEKAQEIANGQQVVYLDVRTASEYASGHIDGAINLDYHSHNFENDLASLDKNVVYIVYCQSGGRSKETLSKMAEMQFKEAYDIKGGVIAWSNAGYALTAD